MIDTSIPEVEFNFAVVSYDPDFAPGQVFTGVVFAKDVKHLKFSKDVEAIKLTNKLFTQPDRDLEVQQASIFFPSHSLGDQEFLKFNPSGKIWTSSAFLPIKGITMPNAFKFSLRVQYTLKGDPRTECIDPMLIIGEEDQGGELKLRTQVN